MFLMLLFIISCSNSGGEVEQRFEFSQGQGFSCKAQDTLTPKAIYGSDDRLDWFESPGITKDYWGKATLALIPKDFLINQADQYRVVAESYGSALNLCPGQRFFDQPTAAFCSGFLVSSDLVVTAGHCIRNLYECMQTDFVFDFAKTKANQSEYTIPKSSVYSCKDIVVRSEGEKDFAIIKLDREVLDRTPINIRRGGELQVGERLMLIGHPMGIPSKIAEGGSVMSTSGQIRASIDAFAANSGSVVLNMATGDAEGILVAGEADFVFQNGCRVEAHCGNDCQGEVITPISAIREWIPNIVYKNPVCD